MPIGKISYGRGYLDPEVVCAMWIVYGTIKRVVKVLAEIGICPDGRSPTTMGVWSSAKRSNMYYNFVASRRSGQVESEMPTKQEIENAKKYITDHLPEQKEKFQYWNESREQSNSGIVPG